MTSLVPPELHPWIVAFLVLAMIGALLTGRFGTDIVFMGVLTGLVASGVISPSGAIQGFANPMVITIALLYVVAAGMKQTGAMSLLSGPLLNKAGSVRSTQARLVAPVAAMSAFVNNTPIVAMFLPVLKGVAKRGGFSGSQLFMPLSFASILGGVCTLIGTSTNLVVAGLLVRDEVSFGGEAVRFDMFTLSWVGVPIAVAGVAYMLLFGKFLLPGRDKGAERSDDPARQYMTAMQVSAESAVVGKTIEAAGLRNLPGLFLSRIDRGEEAIVAVEPEEVIRAADVLVFVGDLDGVVDLQQIRGLTPITDEQEAMGRRNRRELTEAVVSTESQAVGQTVRDAGFRGRYGAVVLAVHRRGHRLSGKIGDITLRPGDTLLLESEPGFAQRYRDSRDFFLMTQRAREAAPHHERAWVAIGILLLLVLGISTAFVSPLTGALIAAGAMILTRCCTGPQARAGMDWPVLVTIGAAFGVAEAMRSSGLAENVANAILGVAQAIGGSGPYAALAVVYGLTVTFTACMTNNAAAMLMFPIAMSVAGSEGWNPLPFAVATAMAASCEFSTPIGYQTNLMVMGPGGYRWRDYTRFGGPLTIMCAIICVGLAPVVYG